MDLTKLIHKGLEEIKYELNKIENMNLIKSDLLNPVITHIIEQLYPYFLKMIFLIITLLILLMIIIFLNIKIIYKN